jgi:DNA-binding NtrC family response regulator
VPIQNPTLLIVDDEPSIRTSLACILTQIGYNVRSACDGFCALDEIEREVPDIVVSDLNMPGMSGFELLSVLSRRFPAIRTIAMSGAFSSEEVPVGVVAQAFYQKGSGVGSLLEMIASFHRTEAGYPMPPAVAGSKQRSDRRWDEKAFVRVAAK